MNKEYLPFFNSLEQKYKDTYMEWSKEQLIDHLVANIKNGEVLLSRIEKAISFLKNIGYDEEMGRIWNDMNDDECTNLLKILEGKEDENTK